MGPSLMRRGGIVLAAAALLLAGYRAAQFTPAASLAHAAAMVVQARAAASSNPSGTMVMTGTGTALVAVDLGVLTCGAERSARSAQSAAKAVSIAVNRATGLFRALHVASGDIQTSYLALTPHGSGAHVSGYTASQGLQVTVHALSLMPRLVDDAVGAGASWNLHVTYGLSDANPVHTQVLRAALLMAKQRASVTAATLVRNIDTARVQVYPQPEVDSVVPAEAPGRNLGPVALNSSNTFPGTLRVSETVTLIYTF